MKMQAPNPQAVGRRRKCAGGWRCGGTIGGIVLGLQMMCAVSALGEGVPVSLSTIIDLALRNSTAVRMASTDVQKANALLTEARQVYIPNLILGSSIGPPSYGFPVGQPSIYTVTTQSLILSFSQPDYIRSARAGVRATEFALKDAKESVILSASSDYLELDSITREIAAADQQQESANRLVEIERQRSEAGVDSLSDLLSARLSMAELKLRRMHLAARFATLRQQLSSLTGLPASAILADPASIPEVPAIRPEQRKGEVPALDAARQSAISRQFQAHGDSIAGVRPQISFAAQYNRDAAFSGFQNYYKNFQQNNVSAGILLTLPIFDPIHRSKRRESAAISLRATIEAEQAQHDNEEQIVTLDGSLAELDALAEVATLKQQIAAEQVKAVAAQLELGNGNSAAQQVSPKSEQLARIEERQKYVESLDAGFNLARARLSLLRAFGHMEDWLLTIKPTPVPEAIAPAVPKIR